MTDPVPTSELKAAARTAAFAARKAAYAAGGDAAARTAAERFLRAVPVAAGAVVSGYRPIRTEIDPTPLMRALIDRGATLCVPVIDGPARPLRFKSWTPDSAMVPGPFGAEIPAEGDWVEPELLIAPLLAFDRALYRLGYGGGFYDRTLERLRGVRPTRAVGLAYGAQRVDAVPREPTDQPLDAVVTEEALFGL